MNFHTTKYIKGIIVLLYSMVYFLDRFAPQEALVVFFSRIGNLFKRFAPQQSLVTFHSRIGSLFIGFAPQPKEALKNSLLSYAVFILRQDEIVSILMAQHCHLFLAGV